MNRSSPNNTRTAKKLTPVDIPEFPNIATDTYANIGRAHGKITLPPPFFFGGGGNIGTVGR